MHHQDTGKYKLTRKVQSSSPLIPHLGATDSRDISGFLYASEVFQADNVEIFKGIEGVQNA